MVILHKYDAIGAEIEYLVHKIIILIHDNQGLKSHFLLAGMRWCLRHIEVVSPTPIKKRTRRGNEMQEIKKEKKGCCTSFSSVAIALLW